MPTYTNPKTGKKIKSATSLSQEQLEEAFGLTSEKETPPEIDRNEERGRGVLEGAGLPSSMDEVGPFVGNLAKTAAMPNLMLPKMLDSILKESGDRTGRFWDTLGDDPTIGRAAQTMMAPIPGLGNFMENADRGIAEDDPRSQGRMVGNALGLAAPKALEATPGALRTAGKGMVDAGKFVANNPTARSLAIGGATLATGGSGLEAIAAGTLGSGRVGRAVRGLEELLTRNGGVDVTDSIRVEGGAKPPPLPIDPRITELKDIKLTNALAKEKGQLPPSRIDIRDAAPVEEIPAKVVDPRVTELKDLRLNNSLAKEKGILPQGESALNVADVTELKRLKLERQLEAERGAALEREGGISLETDPIEDVAPIPKGSAAIDDVAEFPEFPTKYKNVKLKTNVEQKYAPQPPNPYSREDLPTTTDELELGASPTEKMGVPVRTHEQLLAVQDLVATGMSEKDAVAIVTSKPKTNIIPGSRASGTNPRALGLNPRALAKKRQGL